jgi:hypothetical protein
MSEDNIFDFKKYVPDTSTSKTIVSDTTGNVYNVIAYKGQSAIAVSAKFEPVKIASGVGLGLMVRILEMPSVEALGPTLTPMSAEPRAYLYEDSPRDVYMLVKQPITLTDGMMPPWEIAALLKKGAAEFTAQWVSAVMAANGCALVPMSEGSSLEDRLFHYVDGWPQPPTVLWGPMDTVKIPTLTK